jgi:hypothetical protein
MATAARSTSSAETGKPGAAASAWASVSASIRRLWPDGGRQPA